MSSSDSKAWNRLEELFHAGLDLSPEDRQQLIRNRGVEPAEAATLFELWDRASDPVLSRQLGSGLHRRPGEFLWNRGDIVLGRYIVVSGVGQGGMGEVYRAVDKRLNREVALKIFLPVALLRLGLDAREELKREAVLASALQHTNICTIFDVHLEEQPPILAMEFLKGETLAAAIARAPLTTKQVIQHTREMLRALEWAHEKGVIHQDIKPENIMLTPSGLKVIDFGVARFTFAQAIGGSPSYMSPEQLQGLAIDHRTDLFSLGAAVYEMLTGHRAYAGKERDQPPLPIHSLRTRVPRILETFCARCLSLDPNQRFADATTALEFLASAERPRWWLAAVAAMILLVTAVWMGSLFGRKEQPLLQPSRFDGELAENGSVTALSLSPAADTLVYSSDLESLRPQLRLLRHSDSSSQRLTTDKTDEFQPVFHPNGHEIAYTSGKEGGGVYVLDLLQRGKRPRSVAAGGAAPVYSPDGRWLAWTRGEFLLGHGATQLWAGPADGNGRSFRIAADLHNVANPVFGPDSQYIAFTGCKAFASDCEVYVDAFGPSQTQRRRLADILAIREAKSMAPLAWTSSGMFLLLDTSKADQLSFVPLSKSLRPGKPRPLLKAAGEIASVSVAGSRIAITTVNRRREVRLFTLDTDNPRPLPSDSGGSTVPNILGAARDPRLSPSGHYLAYTRSGGDQSNVLAVVDVRNPAETFSFKEHGLKGGPYFISEDRLVFSSFFPKPIQQPSRAFMTRPPGTPPSPFGNFAIHHISHDGKSILTAFDIGVILIDTAGSGLTKKLILRPKPGERLLMPRLSPDKRMIGFVAMSGDTSVRQLFAAPLEGPTEITQENWIKVTAGELLASGPEWSPNGRFLYYLALKDGHICLWAQRFHQRRPAGDPFAIQHFHNEARLGFRDLDFGEQSITAVKGTLSMLVSISFGNGLIADLPRGLYE